MLNILYTYNKPGYEGREWAKEISGFVHPNFRFIPFNHQEFMNPDLYTGATNLDKLYRTADNKLLLLYQAFECLVEEYGIQAIVVNNAPPFHPDYLRRFSLYKCLYSADDPGATYSINIPYLHAYDHVFCVSPSYSQELDMESKMKYAGAKRFNWMPISVFDFEWIQSGSDGSVSYINRDIDIIYIGGFWRQKLPILSGLKKRYGNLFKIYGYYKFKHNLYVNAKYHFKQYVRPVSIPERVSLYRRARIGINLHWDKYGLGNQRLYQLPANGVMQVCDCLDYLDKVFTPGREIVGFADLKNLFTVIDYYLEHDQQRIAIASSGRDKVLKNYRISHTLTKIGETIVQHI